MNPQIDLTIEEIETLVAPRWVKLYDSSMNLLGYYNTTTGVYRYI